jgi:hypothetical protein
MGLDDGRIAEQHDSMVVYSLRNSTTKEQHAGLEDSRRAEQHDSM